MNMITAKSPQGARTPITVDSDRQALQLALASALKIEPGQEKILRIESSKTLTHFLASEPLHEDLLALGTVEQVSEIEEIGFDPDGMFTTAP
jgi:hypothetical protein